MVGRSNILKGVWSMSIRPEQNLFKGWFATRLALT